MPHKHCHYFKRIQRDINQHSAQDLSKYQCCHPSFHSHSYCSCSYQAQSKQHNFHGKSKCCRQSKKILLGSYQHNAQDSSMSLICAPSFHQRSSNSCSYQAQSMQHNFHDTVNTLNCPRKSYFNMTVNKFIVSTYRFRPWLVTANTLNKSR